MGSIPEQVVTAGEVVSLDLTSYFSDPDGDGLTYSAATSAPAVASPTVSGSTMTIAGVSRGTASVTVTASDPGGLTATQSVSVTVERPNTAPTTSGTIPAQAIEAGGEVAFNLAEYFTDPDGDALTFAATSSNTGVAATQISGTLLTIVGVAPGDATVTATATDPGDLSAEQTVMVTVEEASVDRQILTTFYITSEGASWATNTNWLSDGALGTWYGVTTDDRDRVTHLELPDNRLKNSILRELGGLTQLVRLDLNDNRGLEGMIPRQLGDLENLEWLDLSESLFFARGTLPPEFGKLKKLKHLDLSEIIWWLGDDPTIPPEWGDMESLERLDLSHVGLREKVPPQLGNLKNLKWLDISYNVFEGSIPREFMNLKLEPDELDRVVRLELPDNRLENSIPRELGELKQLVRLDLSENRMRGMIPRELGDLENLEYLDLGNSMVRAEGAIPPELGNLKKLKWLDLSETSFQGLGGPIPVRFAKLESLERLDLRDADLEGKLPVQLGDLTNLKWLDISDNWFEGEIPREWMKLKLDYFHWKPIIDDVTLCAPADDEFQNWLNSIPDHEGGKTCGG